MEKTAHKAAGPLRAVIFDFDGVLAESVNIKTEAFRRLFEAEGPEAVKAIEAYHLAHLGISRFEKFKYMYGEVLNRPLDEDEFQRLSRGFEALVLEAVKAAPEVKGASECLKGLYGRLRLFIVSGTPEVEMRLIAEARGIARYFEGIYGAPETKAALVRKILLDGGLEPGDVVFIGDAMTDYRAAMETGTGFIARFTEDTADMWKALGVRAVPDMTGCASLLGLN